MEVLAIPHVSWPEAVVWVADKHDSGVQRVLFDDGSRDPAAFVAGLVQRVAGIRFAIKASSLADRPALLAWKQLVTLDVLSGGRIDVLADDEDFVAAIQAGGDSGLVPLPTGLQFLEVD